MSIKRKRIENEEGKQHLSSLIILPHQLYFSCDLTGEVGRFAVQRATLRDKDGVMICLQTNKSILTALQMMPRFPKDIGKKMDQLGRSVEKLERILYEMSLSEAAGGRNVKTDSMDIEPESKGGGNDNN